MDAILKMFAEQLHLSYHFKDNQPDDEDNYGSWIHFRELFILSESEILGINIFPMSHEMSKSGNARFLIMIIKLCAVCW